MNLFQTKRLAGLRSLTVNAGEQRFVPADVHSYRPGRRWGGRSRDVLQVAVAELSVLGQQPRLSQGGRHGLAVFTPSLDGGTDGVVGLPVTLAAAARADLARTYIGQMNSAAANRVAMQLLAACNGLE